MCKLDLAGAKTYEASRYWCNKAVLVGLRIVLAGDQRQNPTEYLQEYFYGEHPFGVASAGHFHYLPFNTDQRSEDFFMAVSSGEEKEALAANYEQGVSLVDGNTQVEIMVLSEAYETFEVELEALTLDLDDLVASGFAVSWGQITLNAVEAA